MLFPKLVALRLLQLLIVILLLDLLYSNHMQKPMDMPSYNKTLNYSVDYLSATAQVNTTQRGSDLMYTLPRNARIQVLRSVAIK